MQNLSDQTQIPSSNERETASQQMPEYQEGMGPQEGYQYQPPLYTPEPPPLQYAQQQQYQYQPYGTWSPGDVNPRERTSMGLKVGTAALLCYLFGWVGGLVFFLLERENRFVRFHAMQSLLFFGAMSILGWICNFFPYALFGLGGVVGLVSFIGWIVLMVAAHRGRYYKLPLFGDYAEQLITSIRL